MSVIGALYSWTRYHRIDRNLTDMARGVAGAEINAGYVGWVMVVLPLPWSLV